MAIRVVIAADGSVIFRTVTNGTIGERWASAHWSWISRQINQWA